MGVQKSRNHITDGAVFDSYTDSDSFSRNSYKDNFLKQSNQQIKTKSNNVASPPFNSPYNQNNNDNRFTDDPVGKIESNCI